MQDTNEGITRLVSAICELSSATSVSEIAAVVKRTAWDLVKADGVTFVLMDGAQCHYLDEAAIAPLWKGKRFPLSACVSGWSMLYRQQAIIPDIYTDARVPHDAYRPTFVRSLVMTPVGTSEPWAAIGVYWAHPNTPAPEQARCLQALADSTALAMENVRVRGALDRTSAVPRVATPASELVRMCAWTRRIWWHDSWVPVESFLRERFGLDVTHGISDEAAHSLEHMGDFDPSVAPRSTKVRPLPVS